MKCNTDIGLQTKPSTLAIDQDNDKSIPKTYIPTQADGSERIDNRIDIVSLKPLLVEMAGVRYGVLEKSRADTGMWAKHFKHRMALCP